MSRDERGYIETDGPFWASSSRAVPVALAGGAMGLINALGNLGGFAGPYLGGFLQDASEAAGPPRSRRRTSISAESSRRPRPRSWPRA